MGFLVMGVIGYVVKLGMWEITVDGRSELEETMLISVQYIFR